VTTRPANSRRAFTFLETVLASLLLSIIVGVIFSAMNQIASSQTRGQKRLAAAELANRLMIIYMDDDETFRKLEKLIPSGTDTYRYECIETPVYVSTAKEDQNSKRNLGVDRFLNVRMNVWLSEESGGGFTPTPDVPQASIVRILDPLPLRNPDSLQHGAQSGSIIKKVAGGPTRRPAPAPPRGGGK
jgi:type II secretory pathway pseudopilin PulG